MGWRENNELFPLADVSRNLLLVCCQWKVGSILLFLINSVPHYLMSAHYCEVKITCAVTIHPTNQRQSINTENNC